LFAGDCHLANRRTNLQRKFISFFRPLTARSLIGNIFCYLFALLYLFCLYNSNIFYTHIYNGKMWTMTSASHAVR